MVALCQRPGAEHPCSCFTPRTQYQRQAIFAALCPRYVLLDPSGGNTEVQRISTWTLTLRRLQWMPESNRVKAD
jgi:hypothetical protein